MDQKLVFKNPGRKKVSNPDLQCEWTLITPNFKIVLDSKNGF